MKKIDEKARADFGFWALVAFVVLLLLVSVESFSQNSHVQLASNYMENNNFNPSSTADSFYEKGMTFLENQALNKAMTHFKLALKENPRHYPSLSKLAYVNTVIGYYDSAEYYAEKGITAEPSNAMAYINLVQALLAQGKNAEAENQLARAAGIDPEVVTQIGSRFITEHNSLKYAILYFRVVHRIAPDNKLNCLNYSYALKLAGQFESAERVLYPQFKSMNPSHPHFETAYILYHKLLLIQKKYDQILQSASANVPESYYRQYYYMALSHYVQGNGSDFEKNAQLYFQYGPELASASIGDWAKTQIREITKTR